MKYSITKYEDRYVLKINNVTFYDTDETIIQLIKFLSKQNKDLQQRIDKAIEYIESIKNGTLITTTKPRLNSDKIIDELDYENSSFYIEIKKYDLLSILKGEDKEC